MIILVVKKAMVMRVLYWHRLCSVELMILSGNSFCMSVSCMELIYVVRIMKALWHVGGAVFGNFC